MEYRHWRNGELVEVYDGKEKKNIGEMKGGVWGVAERQAIRSQAEEWTVHAYLLTGLSMRKFVTHVIVMNIGSRMQRQENSN